MFYDQIYRSTKQHVRSGENRMLNVPFQTVFVLSTTGVAGKVGLGGYCPHRSMLAPRRKVKHEFVGDFWHF